MGQDQAEEGDLLPPARTFTTAAEVVSGLARRVIGEHEGLRVDCRRARINDPSHGIAER